ncbi:MAG: hypothetical protein IKQ61_00420 [Spirochaetales bacterium]|nr:hypothetical protein [Spirochaetales bacterium]
MSHSAKQKQCRYIAVRCVVVFWSSSSNNNNNAWNQNFNSGNQNNNNKNNQNSVRAVRDFIQKHFAGDLLCKSPAIR